MKKQLTSVLLFSSLTAFAAEPTLEFASKSQVEKVGKEFAANFSHTVVSSSETDGLWGVEVGLIGGTTSSPQLKKTVDASGGDGGDFKSLYNAALFTRVHVPFEIFVEASMLPEQEFSDVKMKNTTFGLGWNAGRYFNLPLDIALGANFGGADASYKQEVDVGGTPTDSKISLKTKSQVYYVGVSKNFLFVTPYAKLGVAKTEADFNVDVAGGTIFQYSGAQKESVSSSGSYFAAGLNFQVLVMRLGVEYAQTVGVSQMMGKFSLSF